MRTLTADDIGYASTDAHAEAISKHETFGYACEVQTAGCVPRLRISIPRTSSACGWNQLGCVIAVSYTHLDVYKRQDNQYQGQN